MLRYYYGTHSIHVNGVFYPTVIRTIVFVNNYTRILYSNNKL